MKLRQLCRLLYVTDTTCKTAFNINAHQKYWALLTAAANHLSHDQPRCSDLDVSYVACPSYQHFYNRSDLNPLFKTRIWIFLNRNIIFFLSLNPTRQKAQRCHNIPFKIQTFLWLAGCSETPIIHPDDHDPVSRAVTNTSFVYIPLLADIFCQAQRPSPDTDSACQYICIQHECNLISLDEILHNTTQANQLFSLSPFLFCSVSFDGP